MYFFENAATLANALKDAAKAHHEYEQKMGVPDADWPIWYADYIFKTHVNPERENTNA